MYSSSVPRFLPHTQERALKGIVSKPGQLLCSETEQRVSQHILPREVGTEHRRIVGGKRHEYASVEIAAQGMILHAGDRAGTDVAGEAHVHGNARARQMPH